MLPNDQLLKLNCSCAEPQELSAAALPRKTKSVLFCALSSQVISENGSEQRVRLLLTREMPDYICSMAPNILLGKAGSQGECRDFEFQIHILNTSCALENITMQAIF